MAWKTTVVLEDDLSGGPAERTVWFALDGIGYEIDLNAQNAAAFRDQLAPYIDHARTPGRPGSGRTAASRLRAASIRTWATQHGIAVQRRGRIPVGVIEQYQAAAASKTGSAAAGCFPDPARP